MKDLENLGDRSYGSPRYNRAERFRCSAGRPLKILLLLLSISCMLAYHSHHDEIRFQKTDNIKASEGQSVDVHQKHELLAYVTFFAQTTISDKSSWRNDPYFTAIRLLGYQIMHSNKTRSAAKYPFVVLVTEEVPAEKIARLRKDGAQVVKVAPMNHSWIQDELHVKRWGDQLLKLRAFEQTQFSRFLYLDGDTVLQRPLDELFTLDEAQFTNTRRDLLPLNQGRLPSQYCFATVDDAEWGILHNSSAERAKTSNAFGANFFLTSPSPELFEHLATLSQIKGLYSSHFQEQEILNYAFRRNGPAPWQKISTEWMVNPDRGGGIANATYQGVAALHKKYWVSGRSPRARAFAEEERRKMDLFYTRFDENQGFARANS